MADDVDEIKKEFVDDYPKYDKDWLSDKPRSFFDMWRYFRVILNWFFVAMPTMVVVGTFDFFNIFSSIAWNKWWARGNIFMIMKTIYMVWQTFNLFPLIFEIDVYLRHMKFFRFISFSVAFLWNFFYFLTVGIFIY